MKGVIQVWFKQNKEQIHIFQKSIDKLIFILFKMSGEEAE